MLSVCSVCVNVYLYYLCVCCQCPKASGVEPPASAPVRPSGPHHHTRPHRVGAYHTTAHTIRPSDKAGRGRHPWKSDKAAHDESALLEADPPFLSTAACPPLYLPLTASFLLSSPLLGWCLCPLGLQWGVPRWVCGVWGGGGLQCLRAALRTCVLLLLPRRRTRTGPTLPMSQVAHIMTVTGQKEGRKGGKGDP